jgi:hypothetical protein
MRKAFFIVAALVAALAVALPAAPAAAAPTSEPPAGCWGELSRGLAQSGGMGEHASLFAGERRVGLANLVPGGMSGLCEFLG